MSDTNRIDAIRDRIFELTALPWHRDGTRIIDRLGQLVADLHVPGRDPQPWHITDADLIAHAPADVAWLLTELDERERNLRTLKRAEPAAARERDELRAEVSQLRVDLDTQTRMVHCARVNAYVTCTDCHPDGTRCAFPARSDELV